MNNVTYLHNWDPELCIQLENGYSNKVDFNRFLFKHIPSTKALQQGGQFEGADREGFIHQLKSRFDEAIEEDGSHSNLLNIFFKISQHLKWCDKEGATAFTQPSLEAYMNYLNERVLLGQIKNSTYTHKRSAMMVTYTQLLDLPSYYFANVVVRGKSDTESFEAYTRSDLKQMLPFLRAFFKQTHQQFIDNPEKHINAQKTTATMTFHWKGRYYQLHAAISKMMCASTFLMAYYTYANTSDLFKLKQPENASTTLGEV